jgi:hypothetical protein
LIIPQRSIVLPLPGSALTHNSRICGLLRQHWKSRCLRIQWYESFSRPPLVSLIRVLLWRGSVLHRSARHLLSALVLCILSQCLVCSRIAELMLLNLAFCDLAVLAIELR